MDVSAGTLVGVSALVAVRGLTLLAIWLGLRWRLRQERERQKFILAALQYLPKGSTMCHYFENGQWVSIKGPAVIPQKGEAHGQR